MSSKPRNQREDERRQQQMRADTRVSRGDGRRGRPARVTMGKLKRGEYGRPDTVHKDLGANAPILNEPGKLESFVTTYQNQKRAATEHQASRAEQVQAEIARIGTAIETGQGLTFNDDGTVSMEGLETEDAQKALDRLNDELAAAAQVGIIEDDQSDNSLWGRATRGIGGVLSAGGNVVMGALDIADAGRAVVVGGARQLGEGGRALMGWEHEGGWSTFMDDVNRRVGVGDIIEEKTDIDNVWVKRGLGFVGDVALDPLTYMTAGTSTAVTRAGQGATRTRRALSTDDVARRVLDWGDRTGNVSRAEGIVRNMSRRGEAAVREIADEIGVEVGVRFAGRNIAGTARLAEATQFATSPLRNAARASAAKMFGQGKNLRQLRLADPVKHARFMMAAEEGQHVGLQFQNMLGQRLKQLDDAFEGSVNMDELRRALDSSAVTPADPATREAADQMRKFLDDARDEANRIVAAAGGNAQIAHLDNYLPHNVTRTYREMVREAGGKVGRTVGRPAIKRTKLKGKTWFGEELKEGTIDELNEIARRHLGDDFLDAFETDPMRIAQSYMDHIGRWVGRHVTEGELARHGLLQFADPGALDRMLRAQQKRTIKAAAKAKAADEKAQKHAARRAAAEAEIPGLRDEVSRGADAAAFDQLAMDSRAAGAQAELDELTARSQLPEAVDDAERIGDLADDLGDDAAAAARGGADAGADMVEAGDNLAAAQADRAAAETPLTGPDGEVMRGGSEAFEASRQEVLARDRKLARNLRDRERRWRELEQKKAELFEQFDLDEIDRQIDALVNRQADGADRVAARAAREADKASDTALTDARRAYDQAQRRVDRLSRMRRVDEGALEAAEEARDEARRQLDELRNQSPDTQVLDATSGAVLDGDRAAAIANAQARVAAAREAGDKKALNTARKALQRAREGTEQVSAPLADANRALAPAEQARLEQLRKVRDVVARYGPDVPADVLRDIDPDFAYSVVRAQTAMAKHETNLLRQMAWGNLPDGYVPYHRGDGTFGAMKVDEGSPTPRRPEVPSDAEIEAQAARMARDAEVVDAEDTLYNASMLARESVQRVQQRVDDRVRELTEAVSEAQGRRRADLEDELEWMDHSARLMREVDRQPHEAMKQIARLEAAAAESHAKYLKQAKRADDWHLKLANSRKAEERIVEQMRREFTQMSDGRWGDPDVAEAMAALDELAKPRKIPQVLRQFDAVMSRWKAYALLSPGYHSRNAMGEFFNNWLGGVPTERYSQWAGAVRSMRNDFSETGLARIKDPQLREAMQAAIAEEQVYGASMGVRDMSDVMDQGAQSGRGILGGTAAPAQTGGGVISQTWRGARGSSIRRNIDPTSMDNVALRANRAAAQKVERAFRGPMYIDRYMAARAAGVSPNVARMEARNAVVKFHFDYDDLAGWEREVAKRVVPFYTWTRKNFPLQLEMMARNPGKYTAYNHAKRNIERGTQDDPFVPDYYQRLAAIRLPWQRDGRNMYWAPDTPFRDMQEVFDPMTWASSMNPILKTPLEMWGERQFFEDIPFRDSYTPIPDSPLWRPIAMTLAHLPFDVPYLGRPVQIDGEWQMLETDLYKLEQAWPLLGRTRRLMPSEERFQDRWFTSMLSTVGGQYTMTHTQQQQVSEIWRRVRAVEDMNDQFDKLNPGVRDELEQHERDLRDLAQDELRAEAQRRGVTQKQIRAEREAAETGETPQQVLDRWDAEADGRRSEREAEREERNRRLAARGVSSSATG